MFFRQSQTDLDIFRSLVPGEKGGLPRLRFRLQLAHRLGGPKGRHVPGQAH